MTYFVWDQTVIGFVIVLSVVAVAFLLVMLVAVVRDAWKWRR